MSTCAICTRHAPHPDDTECGPGCRTPATTCGQACTRCRQHLADQLTDLVELHALISAPTWPTPGAGGPRSADTPLPGGTERLNWLQGADTLDVLNDWITLLADTANLATRTKPTLTQAANHLHQHLDTICRQLDALPDLAEELRHLTWRGRTLAGTHSAGTRIACPAPHPNGNPNRECANLLRLADTDPDPVRCSRCGTPWTREWLIRVGLDTRAEIWQPADIASTLSGIPERTLRRWAEQGHVTRRAGSYELHTIQRHADRQNAANA